MKKQKDKNRKTGSGNKNADQQDSKDDSTEAGFSQTSGAVDNQNNIQVHHIPEALENETGVSQVSTPNDLVQTEPHKRQASLSLQSQLRSSSFRRTSVSQAPTSPPLNGSKSPILPVLSPEGDSVNEIYRKQTSRLDELERENRRLAKDARESETRWKKTEDELEQLREESGEIVELKMKARMADTKSEEVEKLVC